MESLPFAHALTEGKAKGGMLCFVKLAIDFISSWISFEWDVIKIEIIYFFNLWEITIKILKVKQVILMMWFCIVSKISGLQPPLKSMGFS